MEAMKFAEAAMAAAEAEKLVIERAAKHKQETELTQQREAAVAVKQRAGMVLIEEASIKQN